MNKWYVRIMVTSLAIFTLWVGYASAKYLGPIFNEDTNGQ